MKTSLKYLNIFFILCLILFCNNLKRNYLLRMSCNCSFLVQVLRRTKRKINILLTNCYSEREKHFVFLTHHVKTVVYTVYLFYFIFAKILMENQTEFDLWPEHKNGSANSQSVTWKKHTRNKTDIWYLKLTIKLNFIKFKHFHLLRKKCSLCGQ